MHGTIVGTHHTAPTESPPIRSTQHEGRLVPSTQIIIKSIRIVSGLVTYVKQGSSVTSLSDLFCFSLAEILNNLQSVKAVIHKSALPRQLS